MAGDSFLMGNSGSRKFTFSLIMIGMLLLCLFMPGRAEAAAADSAVSATNEHVTNSGGGYAVTGQISGVGYTAQIYDATNGLPTSDANWVLGTRDGYIWIGGYSGIIRYDGSTFERLDSAGGLTSGRCLYEDSAGRIWVGTNDNGVVCLDGDKSTHYTYKDGLTSSSIRAFAEDAQGTVYIGSTSGIVTVDTAGTLEVLDDPRFNSRTIVRMAADSAGIIYCCTDSGDVFRILEDRKIEFFSGEDLGIEDITTIFPDPLKSGHVYYGTMSSTVYHGAFGKPASALNEIPANGADDIQWITYACNRIWMSSEEVAGYLDASNHFHAVRNLPMNNSIWMFTSDYQGNLWFASSRQGVMKVVSNNFRYLTSEAGLPEDVVNSTCKRGNLIYIGSDSGLSIIDARDNIIRNELTEYLDGIRIRCISRDDEDNLWISTFTGDLGLVRYTPEGKITNYTKADGMVDNRVRCTTQAEDGSILVGSNGGLNVIKDGEIVRSVGESGVIANTYFLTVEEGENGRIYAGTDGDGIYVIDHDQVSKIGLEDGLTSEVILRIKKDEARGVYWIITSNSIEYMKDGSITCVSTFPYNNNFDVFYDSSDNLWILSSYGVYAIKARDMLEDNVTDYRLYTIANGLPSAATANSFSELDEEGNLYISCRGGVSEVNIEHYYDQTARVKTGIRSVYIDDEELRPDAQGTYTIPADAGRIQITPAILDYTMSNPTVRVFLEGSGDSGVTGELSRLKSLEYTGLNYGTYDMHIQILDGSTGAVYQDDIYRIVKKPKLLELLAVRILLMILFAGLAGLIVWRIMTGTVIRKQYEQIRVAKEEAERANLAKTRFLANMSHEIRTPINTIMGMDEMILREDPVDVPKPYFMSVINYALDIRTASESLLSLINDLLDMSKIESGKMNLVEKTYDVCALLREIVTMIRVRSREKDLTFDLDIDGEIPQKLCGDVQKIKQVVLNLLTNAVKYTEHGGLTLNMRVEEKTAELCKLRISVKDTGIGIRPEDMEKLFTAYQRLEEEKNSAIQGTGLGLDISRRFAELMGGKLWCESEYGKGSEFIFTLEQRIIDETVIGSFDENEKEHAKGPYVPQFIAPGARILVVDDNPMNLNVIKGLLKATQMDVTTASSGEECLRKISENSYNVVLLDHLMPGLDGVETVGRIREDHPDLPVYALTANSTAGGDEFYMSKGFNGYLSKPIDSVAVEKAIMKHLPEDMISKPEAMSFDPEELPGEMEWVRSVEGISVSDGINASGGVTSYISSLELFYDTLEDSADVIENAYHDNDIRLYTVKVHALKSSARIIGAVELSRMAESLEAAGNRNDTEFINDNTAKLLADLRAYKDKLAPLRTSGDDPDKEEISEDELQDAYAALREIVPQMDYDAAEMVLDQLKEYRLPEEDSAKRDELEKKLRLLDWEGMEELLG
ncbi:Signal transduction histidine kinase [Lachnospiraceae bacterium XBB2008]|nr:Signal transduction histidine kinase [Lachnospiraceae bacterium XBB2008]